MPSEKVGGAVGNVRSAIDERNLNAYLTELASEVAAPVVIKQFQVCLKYSCSSDSVIHRWL